MTNRYDENDIIRREGCMIAGPLKIASYRVKDVCTGEFGSLQIHMTYDNTVMAVLGEESAKLLCKFIEMNVTSRGDRMTTDQAIIWNAAINAAAMEYYKGIGAIRQLRKKFVVTVEHIGTTARQEVSVDE